MAGYREHISVSGMLGVTYGAASVFGFGFTPVQGVIAGCLTGVAGMIPDLDSQTGKPVREMFSLIAAAAPMVMMERLLVWGGNVETAMLLGFALYVAIRYGGATVLGYCSVHRGMFHSIPTMLIAAELTFLAYKSDSLSVKFLMALGVALGVLSHLILDELYSVQWSGVRIKLNKAAGSAFKMFGKNLAANAVTYALLATCTYAALVDLGWVDAPQSDGVPKPLQQAAEELPSVQ